MKGGLLTGAKACAHTFMSAYYELTVRAQVPAAFEVDAGGGASSDELSAASE